MAYAGYLIKIGEFTITGEKYIKYQTFSVTRKIQDLDSYRDANGVLHRNALQHTPIVVSFETPPLNNEELATLLGGIQSNYISALERSVLATVYVPELNDYVSQQMYLAEPEPKIRQINARSNVIIYEPLQLSLIGY